LTETGNVFLLGVEPWNSTVSRVRVANAGVPSTASDQWVGDSPFGAGESITAYQPDLTIIVLGINDAILTNTLSKYTSQMATVIASAQAAGDVILMSPTASQEVGVSALETQYTAYLLGAGLPILDNYDRLGAWAAVNTIGFMDDAHHKNSLGCWDDADFVAQALLAA
jgi:lysophospholipase L1-like esterase